MTTALGALEKAAILVEALPYIRKFAGKTVVIKYGGHAMVDAGLKQAVLQDAVLMKFVGIHPILIHGGGPEITSWLTRLGIESRFVRGQRVTDGQTMEVVEMVLAGKVNKELVAEINRLGGRAIGLSGKDANLLQAEKETLSPDEPDLLSIGNGSDGNRKIQTGREGIIDLGFVGRVTSVNAEILRTVIGCGYIPVVAPIGFGAGGETFNINADYVAGALAGALQADKLVLLTDVEGILADPHDRASLISTVRIAEVPQLIRDGVISGGMIPKVECCMRALVAGVTQAHIIDGRLPHSTLLEVFTDQGIGTMVTG